MSTAADTVAESLVQESRQKRRRIAASLWPRARLVAEILYHQVERDHLFTQASALTYKTLFSLLPIFVLSLLVLSSISAEDGKNKLDAAVKQTLFEQIGINQLTVPDSDGKPLLNPDGSPVTLAKFIEPFIEKAKASIANAATGLVAFAILLYGAISLMIVVEGTFNQIYGSVKPRTWPRRIMLYWCVLTLGPIGVAASIVFGRAAFSTATAGLGQYAWLLSTANLITSFSVSWLLLLLLFRVVPDTYVNWRPAIIGSFLTALSWEIGKWAFSLYVQHAVKNSWYGSMALLPLFMFWIYITWSVVLMGLEVTYIQQYWPLLKRRFFFTRGGGASVVSDLHWVLSLGVLLYKNFAAGKITEAHEAAETLMLPNETTTMLLDGLQKAGLLHEVHDCGYVLARPPELISAYDLLAAARTLCQPPPELPSTSRT
jgi:membrane protein